MTKEELKEHIKTWLTYMDALPAYVNKEDYLYGVLVPHLEKYDKLRELSYEMYRHMKDLSCDLRPLRESMEKYHHFICFEEKEV